MLRGLAHELLALLDDDVPSSADPVLQRLFPDAYGDDAAAAEEFRSLTEDDLREAKRATATAFAASLDGAGGALVLDQEAVDAWLLTLNDLRLAIGTRLGIEEETLELLAEGRLEVDDATRSGYEVYEVLSWLQGTLLDAIE